ncbi:DUF4402 domain-containing protein [Phenylobacterium sp.]|jgi:hypothetical protein|uniref:DUF4402 domain-containing protein n=1 Tax=Phenylobacterium sp. TaxID=1871053 RepID=UPI002F91CF07
MGVRTILLAGLAAGVFSAGGAAAQMRDSVVTNGSITVVDPAQVRHDSDLTVGPVSRPQSGARTANAQAGSYTLTGMAGEAFSISTPETVTLTRDGGTEEIKLKLTPTQKVGAFTGQAGHAVTAKVGVNGSVPVPSNAATGVYKGQYDVTVAYQ